jgi:hypothetical protein
VDVLGIDEIFETDILARETCKNIYKKEYEI